MAGTADTIYYDRRLGALLAVSIAVIGRLLLHGWGYLAVDVHDAEAGSSFAIWEHWDARHHLTIAEHGYESPEVPLALRKFISRFPPAYPMAVRTVAQAAGLNFPAAAFAANVLLLSAASWVLFYLICFEGGSRAQAVAGVLLLNFFPTSYFGNAAYAESLFILALCCYFYAVRVSRNYLAAGVFAAIAVLSRMAAVALLPLHGLVLIRDFKQRGLRREQVAGGALPIVAFILFRLYQAQNESMPGYFASAEGEVDAPLVFHYFPFQEVITAIGRLIENPALIADRFYLVTYGWNQLFLVIAAAICLAGRRKLSWEYSVFSLCYLLMISMIAWCIGACRYLWPLVPLYLLFAKVPPRPVQQIVLAASVILLLYFSKLFVNALWAF